VRNKTPDFDIFVARHNTICSTTWTDYRNWKSKH